MKLEERRQDSFQIVPVTQVIGLHEKRGARLQYAVNLRQKRRREQALADILGIMERLRMIAVHFTHALRRHIIRHETLCVDGGKTQVRQTPLIAAPRRITQHHRQDVDADMVMVRPA